ncbi:MAG: hypothetical protein J6K20_12500 [Thermoguttaceae bacterium]|nr:hypothetical protein [Thermoguttaceae bacterium]
MQELPTPWEKRKWLSNICVYVDDTIIKVDYYPYQFYQKFNWQTTHLTAFLHFALRRQVLTNSFGTAVVNLIPHEPVDGKYAVLTGEEPYFECCEDKYKGFLTDIIVNTYFDFRRYVLEADDREKSRMLAETCERELVDLCALYHWDAEPIRRAFKAFRDVDYVPKSIYPKATYTPDKAFKIGFYFEWSVSRIDIYVLVGKYRSKKVLQRVFLSSIRCDYNAVESYFHSIQWLTPRRFLLRMNDLNGKKKIFDLETGQVEDANPETPNA